jgi:hypothetical protein
MFCLTAVLRSDRKERCHFVIRSLTPPQAAGNALAYAVQVCEEIQTAGGGLQAWETGMTDYFWIVFLDVPFVN